jgi:hypothetical protein
MISHTSTPGPTKPILIIGAPGSGTTLLYQTLCSHRDLAYINHNMLRAGIYRHGRFVGNQRKSLFILQNLIHRDPDSNLPHEADIFWMKYFRDYYNYMTENDYTEEMDLVGFEPMTPARIFLISIKYYYIDELFQESAFTIMHCQHDNRFLLVLANFSFLPHILQ